MLSQDTTDKYIVYRFGTTDKIELNFPKLNRESWHKFTYSYYLRGGVKNEGLDLNYLSFVIGQYKYVICQTYSSVDDKKECGIKIIDFRTNRITEIKGDPETIKGSLMDLRNNEFIQIGEELFD